MGEMRDIDKERIQIVVCHTDGSDFERDHQQAKLNIFTIENKIPVQTKFRKSY